MSRVTLPHRRPRPIERNLDEPPHPGRKLTEQEFIDWCTDNTFAEWVDGEVILMTPISDEHDSLFGFVGRLLAMFVEERDLGRVLTEPFQIRFGRLRRRRSPDIMFVATEHLERVKRINLEGPPDMA